VADPNRVLFESVVRLLAPVLDDLVFVGGCTTGLFITDPAAGGIRPTNDVDAIVEPRRGPPLAIATSARRLQISSSRINSWSQSAVRQLARRTEVPGCEGAARAGLQVALEAQCFLLARELDGDDWRPGPMRSGLPARAVIVPFETILDVARHADVVTLVVDVAPQDVDEALPDSSHARAKAILGPICRLAFRAENWGLASPCLLGCADPAIAEVNRGGSNCVRTPTIRGESGFESAGVRLRPAFDGFACFGSGYGETAFACGMLVREGSRQEGGCDLPDWP
jgi:hypothetical protein